MKLVVVGLAMAAQAVWAQNSLSFFITSQGPGDGAKLGGLAGADAHCKALATKVGAGNKEWRAYLSTAAEGGKPAVNAKDRIGNGPWVNAKGVTVAKSVADLHSDSNQLTKANSITEAGEVVNGRGDTPNKHDVLTGSKADGTVADGDAKTATCSNWTSNAAGEGSAMAGHHDRQGGGPAPTSWNASHPTRGCSQENLKGTGGDGLFYCFAAK